MTRKLGASLQPAGRRFVYDKDPDENTRPDTVPAALRFAEASALQSGIEHARPRELAPYPRLKEMTLPDITAANDEATTVDPPLARPKKDLPSGPRHRSIETISTVPPPHARHPSGPRHRPIETISTVPPPSHARHRVPLATHAVTRPVEPPRIVEQARIVTTSPPAAPPKKRWPTFLALAATAFAAAVFGTTLGNGSLGNAVGHLHLSPKPSEANNPPPALPTRDVPPTSALPRSAEATPTNEPPITSFGEAAVPPVVRVEDLPLAEEGKGRRVSGPGSRFRAKAAVRR
jgi:hypothetical protein